MTSSTKCDQQRGHHMCRVGQEVQRWQNKEHKEMVLLLFTHSFSIFHTLSIIFNFPFKKNVYLIFKRRLVIGISYCILLSHHFQNACLINDKYYIIISPYTLAKIEISPMRKYLGRTVYFRRWRNVIQGSIKNQFWQEYYSVMF